MNSIPAKQLLMSGTKSELALNLLDREIGWSTDDNAPYIKLDGALVKFGGEGGNKEGLSTALDNNHYSVEIAGREYRCTKIGNQLWMSENLATEAIGEFGTDVWVYNNDDAYAEQRNLGLLYAYTALNDLHDFLVLEGLADESGNGWRLTTTYDFESIRELLDKYSLLDFALVSEYAGEYRDSSFGGVGRITRFWAYNPEAETGVTYTAQYGDYNHLDLESFPYNCGFSTRLVLDLNPDGTIPDDFKSLVKIKSASAAENLVQSNTIHTPEVFGEDDEGTPISQVFEQYKTSGSLRVLMKGNSDIEVVCEATVNIIHASAGDTMMLWIDNPDVPNGKILYELDDGMAEWPEPTYIKTPYNAPEDGETYGLKNGKWAKVGASLPRRFTGVSSPAGDAAAVRIANSASVSFPISDSSYIGAGYISWVMQAVMAPQSLGIKTGDKFELKINHSQSIGTMSGMFFALARTTGIVTTGGPAVHSYEVLTKPIAPRALTGVQNEAFSGQTASNPLIFEFKKNARFRAGDYLFLMVGKKRDDTDWSGFLMVGNQAIGAWNDPIALEFPVASGYSLDDESFVTEAGIIGDTFTMIHGAPGATSINNDYSQYNENCFAFSVGDSNPELFNTSGQVWSSLLMLDEVTNE